METKNFEDFEKGTYECTEPEKYSVEEFQDRFDELMQRVEGGERIAIYDGENTAVLMPVDDEFVKIYKEFNNEAP